MATRLSLLWDWHLFPSVVSHEMGTRNTQYSMNLIVFFLLIISLGSALHYYNRFLSQSVLKRMSLAISNALRARRFSEALVGKTKKMNREKDKERETEIWFLFFFFFYSKHFSLLILRSCDWCGDL